MVITDVNPYRLELARKMGVTRAVNTAETPLAQVQKELGMQEGFDVGLEMSGNPAAFREMLANMSHGAKIAMLGIPSQEMAIDWNLVVFNMLTIKGIYGREMYETWYKMAVMLESGVDIRPVITHRFSYKDFEQAFAVMRSGIVGQGDSRVGVMSGQPFIIDVVSDVVCPWCFIGKRRLEKALALLGRKDVRVHWKPFELNPDAPKEGMNRAAYRARKFGSLAHAQQLEAHVVEAGAEEGIGFRFDRIERVPNTFDAHRLIWLAAQDRWAGRGRREPVPGVFHRCRGCGNARGAAADRGSERS